MVRIVSGAQDSFQDPGLAFLAGHNKGQEARRQRQAMAQDQMAKMMQMQELGLRMAKFKAERDEMLAKQGGLGNMQALQEMALRSKMKPSEEMQEVGMTLLGSIKDPEQRAKAAPLVEEIIGNVQRGEGYEAAEKEIQRAAGDKHIDDVGLQEYMGRLQTKRSRGESADDLLTELSGVRKKAAESTAHTNENQLVMQQARAFIDTLPANDPRRQQMEYAYTAYDQSPSTHAEKGSAMKLLSLVQRLAGKPEKNPWDEYQAQFTDPGVRGKVFKQLQDELGTNPTEAQLKERIAFLGPPATTGGMALEGRGDERRAAAEAARPVDPAGIEQAVLALTEETRDPIELAKRLQEQGVKLTPEVQAVARAALQKRRNSVGSAGGADR